MSHTKEFVWSSPLVLLNQEYNIKPCHKTSNYTKVPIFSKFSRLKLGFGKCFVQEKLEPLWNDGYGSQNVNHYFEAAKTMVQSDGGPPRWFCPIESGPPLKNSPLLLFLPGMDGVGMSLIQHHKALGKVFYLRCMHIPAQDRTPYEGLIKFVEESVVDEHLKDRKKPIYLVGESFGGCLALSVAARNPTIDLVLILVNPATSFNKSQIRHLLPFLEAFPEDFPDDLHTAGLCILGLTLGNPFKMAKVNNNAKNVLRFDELHALLAGCSTLAGILPKKTLVWKLKLLESAASHADSRLHAVEAEVLILASGRDGLLPSESEAQRLSNSLKNCKLRLFKDSTHALLMEDGINLLTIIKGACVYRRSSKRRDYIADFLPPSMSEFRATFDHKLGLFRLGTSPVMLSTLEDGKIVRGLDGIPDQGPVLLVGYHMLLGTELGSLVEEFLRQKNVMVHGMAHPEIFNENGAGPLQDTSGFDMFKVFGAVPATASNFFKLLAAKSYVLLYPGGVREALHRKGESYKLFWPQEPEFVRMAIRFGAKIVPFGVVGEDDVVELVLDYDEQMRIPFLSDMIRRNNVKAERVRPWREIKGEMGNQDFFVPGFVPKFPPGRFYFLFGKATVTEGMEELPEKKESVDELYRKIRGEVERNMAYLIEKREEDPYRDILSRLWYRLVSAPVDQIPTFDDL